MVVMAVIGIVAVVGRRGASNRSSDGGDRRWMWW
jgi:hypothetical protein